MQKKKIVVFGATGSQGGAVVKALLLSGTWEVAAVTRYPASAAAAALQVTGADIIRADLLSQADVAAAVKGAYGVFAVTQPWSGEKSRYDLVEELRQVKTSPGPAGWPK
jgi:uncharacterized protein YbjT (DUF2867 family)